MDENTPKRKALERLFKVALQDSGQARRVANFLLAWHNASENCGWDITDLWGLDEAIVADVLSVVQLIGRTHAYADNLGFREQMRAVWERWRGTQS